MRDRRIHLGVLEERGLYMPFCMVESFGGKAKCMSVARVEHRVWPDQVARPKRVAAVSNCYEVLVVGANEMFVWVIWSFVF